MKICLDKINIQEGKDMTAEIFKSIKKYVEMQQSGALSDDIDGYYLHIARTLFFAKQNKKPADIFYRVIINDATADELFVFLKTLNPAENVLGRSQSYIEDYIEKIQKAWIADDFKKWYSMYIHYSIFAQEEFFSTINNLLAHHPSQIILKDQLLFLDSDNKEAIDVGNVDITIKYTTIQYDIVSYQKNIQSLIDTLIELNTSSDFLIEGYQALLIDSVFKYFAYFKTIKIDNIFIPGKFTKGLEAKNIWCPVFSVDGEIVEDDYRVGVQIKSQYDLIYRTKQNVMFGFSDGSVKVENDGMFIFNS